MTTEVITRYRATDGGFDENGDPVPGDAAPVSLTPVFVAPGATNEVDAVGRDGESVEYTVYFRRGEDVLDGDELEIRGVRYRARIRDWVSPKTGFGGLEVLATMRRG